jgi:hypothetical protein
MQKSITPPGRRSFLQKGAVKPFGPRQRIRRSPSVQALNTTLGGASKRRVMTSTGSAGIATALFLTAMLLLLALQLVQVFVQAIDALLPATPVFVLPVSDVLERPHLKAAGPGGSR